MEALAETVKTRNTVQDILDMPEGVRAELIDGVLYDMAAPSSTHQRIAGRLYRKIADFFDRNNRGCEAFIAPFAVFVNDDDYNYVEPDIVVVCDKNKIKKDGCHGAPDLVAEVVSESGKTRDYLTKLRLYDDAGVGEYWIVDPESRRVITYRFEKDEEKQGVAEYAFGETLTSWLFPDMEIDLTDIDAEGA